MTSIPIEATAVTGLLAAFSDELADIADGVRNSVVEVRAHEHGNGAGTIWRADGVIITNHHVTPREQVDVRLVDGRSFPATVIARDEENDLVALKIAAQGLPAIVPGDARTARPGELVFAVGHPFGVRGSVTAGVISSMLSESEAGPRGRSRELVRADVTLGPGNSGGPLVDAHGRVIGINAMVSGGMALAVPSHLVERLITRRGERRALGVSVRDVELTPAAMAAAGLPVPRAALVVGLAAGGPAEQAGIIVGDLLTAVGGSPLSGAENLVQALAAYDGDTVRLGLLRGGTPIQIDVQLVAIDALRAA